MKRWTRIFGLLMLGGMTMTVQSAPKLEKATFAGGCFWCMEPPFEQLKGVSTVTAGYTGGHVQNPTYEDVSSGSTGHAEAVQVEYDPTQVTYEQLLEVFWRNIDPTQVEGQFADHGSQYRTSIFYHNDVQKKLAEDSKAHLEKTKKFPEPIVTEVVPATAFYRAEDYHQGYARKNAFHYGLYRQGSGRGSYLKKTWGADH
jgi:methionine-S-sulfoxide reductase